MLLRRVRSRIVSGNRAAGWQPAFAVLRIADPIRRNGNPGSRRLRTCVPLTGRGVPGAGDRAPVWTRSPGTPQAKRVRVGIVVFLPTKRRALQSAAHVAQLASPTWDAGRPNFGEAKCRAARAGGAGHDSPRACVILISRAVQELREMARPDGAAKRVFGIGLATGEKRERKRSAAQGHGVPGGGQRV